MNQNESENVNDPLPEILQADWNEHQILALFTDLEAGTQIQHVQLRTDQQDKTATLAEARQCFLAGEARAIQVRYLFEGEHWCDTMIPGSPLTTIIRNRVPSLPESL